MAIMRTNDDKEKMVDFVGPIDNVVKKTGGKPKVPENPLLYRLSCSTMEAPKQIKNAQHMMETFAYPLMAEGLGSINNDYYSEKLRDGRWNRDTYSVVVTKLSEGMSGVHVAARNS